MITSSIDVLVNPLILLISILSAIIIILLNDFLKKILYIMTGNKQELIMNIHINNINTQT
ncbi:hypothetical protein HERIO_1033 [Hepatospora eriocheir]|uniref:Uncharacterized protein n=1 Tax=Hepatospora eriocheir TaxID=1081669 RepID=A0A1X0QBK2_9MICR|nr:hypothetical protein HERIO_1033 [Hepatospora eriocheir]